MNLKQAKELRKYILEVLYNNRDSLPKRISRNIGTEFEGSFRQLTSSKPWNRIAIGYSFRENDVAKVRLELRAFNQTKGLQIARSLAKKLGENAHLRVVKEPLIAAEVLSLRRALDFKKEKLNIGLSIGADSGSTGTIGGFVFCEDGDPAIISCYHVIGGIPGGDPAQSGEVVYQPGPANRRPVLVNRIAELYNYEVLSERDANETDSAVAKLSEGIRYEGNIIPVGYGFPHEGELILELPESYTFGYKQPVFKIGKTTGYTEGYISAISIDEFSINFYDKDMVEKKFRFNNVIEIGWGKDKGFSAGGDSGSLVYTIDKNKIYGLGILFAKGLAKSEGSLKYSNVTYACTLKNVLLQNMVSWVVDE